MANNVILDNDLFVILAGADLLDAWIEICSISSDSVFVLPSLPRILQRGKGKLCQNHSSFVIKAARLQVEKYKTLPLIEAEKIEIFENIEKIDIGERQIYAHLLSEDYILAGTNDKKSIQALHEHPRVAQLIDRKIVCLEQCLCALIKHKGWSVVNQKILRLIQNEQLEGKKIDSRLSCIFSQYKPGEDNTRDALISFMTPLIELYGDVLYPNWRDIDF